MTLVLLCSPVFHSVDTLETCVFEGDGWEEEEQGRTGDEGGVSAASVAFSFLLNQSYICALIAMMAWSITYVSWLTCVLLLWSCVLWMMRERRRYTLMSSPWLVTYGNFLVILQYIYSFPAVREVPGLFPKKEDPCRELSSKVLLLLPLLLVLLLQQLVLLLLLLLVVLLLLLILLLVILLRLLLPLFLLLLL